MRFEEDLNELAPVFDFIDAHQEHYLDRLIKTIQIPSVTHDTEACAACADLLLKEARQIGLNARLDVEDSASPVLYAQAPGPAPILIGYAHYDVKPAGDLRDWTFDPWAGNIKNGRVYGRGAVDNKSGCLAFLFAAEAFLNTTGIPVDLRLVMEGEEETGSAHLEQWAMHHEHELAGAAGLFCLDGSVDPSSRLPRIDLFGRGMLYVQLTVATADVDLHSSRSVLLHNAAWRLISALNTIKDVETDKVKISGWADELIEPTQDDLDYFRERLSHFDPVKVREELGLRLPYFPGSREDLELMKAYYLEPTCTVCGFWAGNVQPEEIMTIVPGHACVKLDFRCPPNLNTDLQAVKLREHLDRMGFEDVHMQVLTSRGHTWHTSHRNHLVKAIEDAGLMIFGESRLRADDAPSQEGVFYQNFGIPPVLTGFANPDCRIHAPDENLVIENYFLGIKYAAAVMNRFAKVVR